MKITTIVSTSYASRTIKGIIACLGLASTTAFAAPIGQVGVFLSGQVLGTNKEIHITSLRNINASQQYQISLQGQVRAETGTLLEKIVQSDTKISKFLESLSVGSSKYYNRTISNPTGKLPCTLISRDFIGSRTLAGYGKFTFKFTVLGKILADGKCTLDVTNVKFKTDKALPPGLKFGTLKFIKAKLVVTAAPGITFRRLFTTGGENGGTVQVPVHRFGNRHGAVSVKYSTSTGTATAEDFVATSGTLNFADDEIVKNITVSLINNGVVNTSRRFTINLSEPSANAYLGAMTSTTVLIADDE